MDPLLQQLLKLGRFLGFSPTPLLRHLPQWAALIPHLTVIVTGSATGIVTGIATETVIEIVTGTMTVTANAQGLAAAIMKQYLLVPLRKGYLLSQPGYFPLLLVAFYRRA